MNTPPPAGNGAEGGDEPLMTRRERRERAARLAAASPDVPFDQEQQPSSPLVSPQPRTQRSAIDQAATDPAAGEQTRPSVYRSRPVTAPVPVTAPATRAEQRRSTPEPVAVPASRPEQRVTVPAAAPLRPARPEPDTSEDETTYIPTRRSLREEQAPAGRRSEDDVVYGGVADLVPDHIDHEDEHPMDAAGYDEDPHSRRRAGRSCLLLVLALALVLGGLGFAVTKVGLPHFGSSSSSGGDYTGNGTGSVNFTVHQGDSGTQIAANLVADGVVKSASTFLSVANGNQQFTSIQPGTYKLREHMSSQAALSLMLNPASFVSSGTTIPEGLWDDEIFALLSKSTGVPLANYKKVTAASLDLPPAANGDMEGFLFPSTYNFPTGATAQQQLQTMVNQGKTEYAALGIPASQLRQVITVASLVQAESKLGSDGPKVARVIYNRVAQGMPLQFDSTIHFAEQKRGTVTTSNQERASKSPYNTYLVKGLPPGPIDNPGVAAINAALHPAAGSWLYFVTVNLATGETLFADTYPEQQQNENQFHAWCQANPGKC